MDNTRHLAIDHYHTETPIPIVSTFPIPIMDLPTPTSRPLLIFKHNPKAGGGSTMRLLDEMKGNTYDLKRLQESKKCRKLERDRRGPPMKKNHHDVVRQEEISRNAKGDSRLNELKSGNNTYTTSSKKTDDFHLEEEIHLANSTNNATNVKCYGKMGLCFSNETCVYSLNNLTARNDALVYIHESNRVTPEIQRKGFVISSMREPCDHYLSLWAFGSAGKGHFYKEKKEKLPSWSKEAHGQDAPTFDSPRDIHAFQNVWLRNSTVRGLIAWRHYKSFGVSGDRYPHRGSENMLDRYAVDCWIFVDDYESTFYSCLREYEAQGGVVNWTAPLLSKLVQGLQEKMYYNKRRLQSDTILTNQTHTKNDPLHSPQKYHHSRCSKYYDNETASLVRFGREKFIYDHFGYESCCGGRVPINTVITPPPPVETSSYERAVRNGIKLSNEIGKMSIYDYVYSVMVALLVCLSFFFLKRKVHFC